MVKRRRMSVGAMSNLNTLARVAGRVAGNYLRHKATNRQTSGSAAGGGKKKVTEKATGTAVNDFKNFNISTPYIKPARRMTRRRARAIKRKARWTKRVQWAAQEDNGTKVYTVLHFQTLTNPAGFQQLGSFAFYGNGLPSDYTPTTQNGYTDLRLISEVESATPSVRNSSFRIWIMSMHTTFVMRNSGNVASPAIVDVYKITNKKPRPGDPEGGNITLEQIEGLNNAVTLGASTKLAVSSLNYTPFQNPQFLKKFSILSKQTLTMTSGETMTWEIKNKKPYLYDLTKEEQYAYVKPTFFYLFIVRGTLNSTTGQETTAEATSVTIQVHTRYHYKRDELGNDGMNAEEVGEQINP